MTATAAGAMTGRRAPVRVLRRDGAPDGVGDAGAFAASATVAVSRARPDRSRPVAPDGAGVFSGPVAAAVAGARASR